MSSDATLPDIRIAAHEAVHVNDIKGTEAYSNFESIVCENVLWDSDAFLEVAKKINDGNYHGRYDISKLSFGNAFVRELTAYVNEYVVYDIEKATKLFSSLFDNWDAVVEASRKFNEDIGIDYTIAQSNSNNSVSEADSEGSAFSMDENSELQSNANDGESDIETMSFEEDGVEDTTEELSYEEKIMLESSGIDSSITQKQKRINRIAEKLGVKIAWDVDGAPSEVGNGYYENGIIHMNKRAKALATVFAHEYIHHIEQSKLWPSFKKFIENTKAYKDWITARGGNSDPVQAEKNYRLRLETAYGKADKAMADSDVIANFMAERFFGGSFEGDTKSEENAALLLSEISKSDKWYHNIIRWARQMISKFKGDKLGEEFYKMEGLLLKARKDVQKNPTTNTGGRKYSIINLDTGKSYVQASRQVIHGNSVAEWRSQISNFFNKSLKNGPITIETIEGDVLTISKETANKARSKTVTENGVVRELTDREFLVKLNAESHIDELAEISKKNKGAIVPDSKNHIFAKDGFTYRTVYFQDFDNSYYKITISVGENNGISTVYNVGKIKADDIPDGNIISTIGSKADMSSTNHSIPNSAENVNEKSGNQKNSVTPASEAETIARLAEEGRSAEYIQSRVNATINADSVANRWLTTYKSSYDKTKLAERINRMVQLSNNNVWDSVLELAKEKRALKALFFNTILHQSKDFRNSCEFHYQYHGNIEF